MTHIVLWPRDQGGQLTLHADDVMRVRPHRCEDADGLDSFDGADVTCRDGTTYHVDETCKTINARLGVAHW